jgi:hypothetical protein
MCFFSTFSNSYEKWVTYILANGLHLCVFIQCQTYDGDPPSTPCHELIVTPLHDLKKISSSVSKSSPSLVANYNGVIGSSSYFGVPSFCSINAS